MAQELYSSGLSIFSEAIENPALQGSLSSIQEYVKDPLRILKWDDGRIAVPIKVGVELPPLGNQDNIDIRNEEPILLVFSLNDYPVLAPMVFTDRQDFPKNNLAHLYIAVGGKPPAFCYVRGNMDEWYSGKRITDLIIRISNWLRDAATGDLTQNGDQFEPLRLEGYEGTIIYNYNALSEIVKQRQGVLPDMNFHLALFERINEGDSLGFKFVKTITPENFAEVLKDVELEKANANKVIDKINFHYGYVLWGDTDETFPKYVIDLPKTWEGFKTFCGANKIDWTRFEEFVAKIDPNDFIAFPVIVAIRRPSNLIGFDNNIEFVNLRFNVDTPDAKDGKFINDFRIVLLSHNQPLTTALAKKISDNATIGPIRLINMIHGCGALGSKVVMHFARSGVTDMFLVDPDVLSPHNMVRHALLSDSLGVNKATALAKAIQRLFPVEKIYALPLSPAKADVIGTPDFYKSCGWYFDFTASNTFFNKLVLSEKLMGPTIARGSISGSGDLGILFKEGVDRNPRIDDLQASLFHMSRSDRRISQWLMKEHKIQSAADIIVNVGVGCNSETTVLSDTKVSTHASFIAGALINEMTQKTDSGKIFLSFISENPSYSIDSNSFSIAPFEVLSAVNDSQWQIRFRNGVIGDMKRQYLRAKPKETGGVFVGTINYKTKTIHVLELIAAPKDSKANGVCFIRGVKGLPNQVAQITSESGSQLGYIGEWHSHPHGPNNLSEIDLDSVGRFKEEFDALPTPLPVFIAIMTPVGILPYVF